jgi:hypothetical protein
MWEQRSVGGWWQAVGTGGAVGFSAWRSAHVRGAGGRWPSGPRAIWPVGHDLI